MNKEPETIFPDYSRNQLGIADANQYYGAELSCPNCRKGNPIWIKKGLTIATIRKRIVCDNCGCEMQRGK